ncbi:MAG: hypothetical protein FJ299_15630 [Planctomycetes bacterium]|nr:hypothetical protein [Planctomycetota bacterium]
MQDKPARRMWPFLCIVNFLALWCDAQAAGPAGQTLYGGYSNALNDIEFRLRNGTESAYSAFSERASSWVARRPHSAGTSRRKQGLERQTLGCGPGAGD